MEALTVQQLFGSSAVQDEAVLTITKAELPLLTPSANNTAESLLVAILLKSVENFQGILTDENNRPITDENGTIITFDNLSLDFEILKVFRWNPYRSERLNQPIVVNPIIIELFTLSLYAD